MPKLYQFPALADRDRIHRLIAGYARGHITRDSMMRAVADIVKKYPVSRFPVRGYSVRILAYYGDLPIISIEGCQISDTCPACGAGEEAARYLRTEQENLNRDYDIISQTCLECGCVYMSKAQNGRRGVK